jgi:adenine-specific DNA-methyltransferase
MENLRCGNCGKALTADMEVEYSSQCCEYFCSADIYIINELNSLITYDYLQSYLNSTIFEFYFKCQAKKVGVGIYEYYPNKLNLMKIYLPNVEIQQKISFLGKFSIEYFLKKVFNIGEEENQIINKFIFREGDDAD